MYSKMAVAASSIIYSFELNRGDADEALNEGST